MRIAGETNVADNMPRAQLSVDEVANALSFLTLEEIMPLRHVNMTWKDAAKKTIVPPTDFCVYSVENYNTMTVMTEALPNLQQMSIGDFGHGHKYSDGEDPDERVAARTANLTSHDIGIISNFRKLRYLKIEESAFGGAPLNGRYPVFFGFPLLQKLSIQGCNALKWDLGMLAGLPLLKELNCCFNICLTGNINSLRVLKDTLEKVTIRCCENVEGNFMDLADFPNLKKLDLLYTTVTGDIRDIGDNDFSSLDELILPKGVYGGEGYEFQRISDAPDVVRAVYLLKKQRPALAIPETWCAILSRESPDRYDPIEDDPLGYTLPFSIRFVKAGSRIGYRWETANDIPCEMNWLDPAPDRESSDYGKYIEEQINSEVHMFRGFHQPPTEEEYHRRWEEYNG
jgi:hypothetical protein